MPAATNIAVMTATLLKLKSLEVLFILLILFMSLTRGRCCIQNSFRISCYQ